MNKKIEEDVAKIIRKNLNSCKAAHNILKLKQDQIDSISEHWIAYQVLNYLKNGGQK